MGYGSFGGFSAGSSVVVTGFSSRGYMGLSGNGGSNNNDEDKKPKSKDKSIVRTVGKYLIYLYLAFCAIYTVHKYINREMETCGIIENKYSVPWVHKGGDITYTNYISINNHEIKASNNVFYTYDIGENVCIKYTTNVINIHQIIGGLVIIIAVIVVLLFCASYIFKL